MITRGVLEIVLRAFEIPIETWGKGNAKTVDDLLKELRLGESYLRIGPGLARVTRLVRIQIKDDTTGRCLMEVSQTLPNGQTRTRHCLPGGKVRGDEDPEKAMFRELHEELRLCKEELISHSKVESHFEEQVSPSFPGLPSILEVHLFSLKIASEHWLLDEDQCFIKEEDGTSHVFRWVAQS